jgi:surface polysaccharide O-acyltransferase-like enzyme
MSKQIIIENTDTLKSNQTTLDKPKKLHLDGFDYLRVFFMSMVLLGHSNFFIDKAASRQEIVGAGPNLWDYLFYGLQASAVPSFILMSMVLFALSKPTFSKTLDRVKKMGYLYCFWVGAWVIYTKARPEPTFLGLIEFFLRGGGWLFYTFATLILLTPLCWIASILSKRQQLIGFVLSTCVVIGTFLWIYDGKKWLTEEYYWVPSCFTMLPFVGVLLAPYLAQLRDDAPKRWRWVLVAVVLGLIAAVVEWQFAASADLLNSDRRWMTKFARLSVQFFATAMLLASLGVKCPAPKVIEFFARNSLGVYCIHPFILSGVVMAVVKVTKPWAFGLETAIGCVVLAVICSLLTEFLRKTFKQRLV